jgi:hypothetical protein
VGGILKRTKFVNGRALNRIYYGIGFKNVPHDIDAGNSVPVYPISMVYGGWVDGILAGEATKKVLWAIGNKVPVGGIFGSQKVGDVKVHKGQDGDSMYAANNWAAVPDFDSGDALGTGSGGNVDNESHITAEGTSLTDGASSVEAMPAS